MTDLKTFPQRLCFAIHHLDHGVGRRDLWSRAEQDWPRGAGFGMDGTKGGEMRGMDGERSAGGWGTGVQRAE